MTTTQGFRVSVEAQRYLEVFYEKIYRHVSDFLDLDNDELKGIRREAAWGTNYIHRGAYRGLNYEIHLDWFPHDAFPKCNYYNLSGKKWTLTDLWKQSITIAMHPVTKPAHMDTFNSFASSIEEYLITFDDYGDNPAKITVEDITIDMDGHGR